MRFKCGARPALSAPTTRTRGQILVLEAGPRSGRPGHGSGRPAGAPGRVRPRTGGARRLGRVSRAHETTGGPPRLGRPGAPPPGATGAGPASAPRTAGVEELAVHLTALSDAELASLLAASP